MQFTPVQSRMILGARYNEQTQEMDIVFQKGGTYRYKRVPPFVYEELLNADSHGQYMHKTVLGKYAVNALTKFVLLALVIAPSAQAQKRVATGSGMRPEAIKNAKQGSDHFS